MWWQGQCHLLSLAARVHNAIPIIYALLHCRCKSRPCLAFNLDNFTGIRSRESPSSQGCKGMFVAKLKFHFDINVNINGICGNISWIYCEGTIESISLRLDLWPIHHTLHARTAVARMTEATMSVDWRGTICLTQQCESNQSYVHYEVRLAQICFHLVMPTAIISISTEVQTTW